MKAAPADAVMMTPVFLRAGARETVGLLVAAWAIPCAIHPVPWSGERPLGAYVLPMFWTTLVAIYFFGALTGVVPALCAPAINLIVTGLPAWRGEGFASFELLVFVGVMTVAVWRWPRFVLAAPLGYVVAKLATAVVPAVLGLSALSANALGHSFARAAVVVLAAIHAGLGWLYPKTPRDDL